MKPWGRRRLPQQHYPGSTLARIAPTSILPPVALDGSLDLRDRALDLVIGQVALRSLAVGQRQRAIDFGLELAQAQSLGYRRRRLFRQRLRPPPPADDRKIVALGPAAQLGFAHHRRRRSEDRSSGQRPRDLLLRIYAPQAVGA